MSTTLQDHVLGKRKSIGPNDQFSAKGEAFLVEKEEAILGEKKDATVDEKEKELGEDPGVGVGVGEDEKASDDNEEFCSFAEVEANLLGKEEAILGEKIDATVGEKELGEDPCVGVGEEEKACDEDDYDKALRCLAAKGKAVLVEKEGAILGEKKDASVDEKEVGEDPCVGVVGEEEKACEDDEYDKALQRLAGEAFVLILGEKKHYGPCLICRDPDHMNCPWVRGMYCKEVPVFRPLYRALCKRCYNTKFDKRGASDYLSCTKCGCHTIKAVRKSCPWCMKSGHLSMEDKECDFFGKEWTAEDDPILSVLFKRHNITAAKNT